MEEKSSLGKMMNWVQGRKAYQLVFLALIFVSLPYLNSLSNGFVWDDVIQLPSAETPVPNLKDLFVKPSWGQLHPDQASKIVIATYRPLLLLSFLADAKLGKGSPFVFHLSNLLIALALVATLMLIGLSLFKAGGLVLLTVLLWGTHPMLTESISWISGRHDVLMLLMMLLSTFCLLKAGKFSGAFRFVWVGLALLFYLGSLFSKEPAIFYPVILFFLLYDWREKFSFSKKESVAILSVFGLTAIIYLWFRSQVVSSGNLLGSGMAIEGAILSTPWAYLKYLVSFFYLPHLSTYYRNPLVWSALSWQFIVPLLIHIGILWGAFRLRRHSPWPWLGCIIFYLFLAPSFVMLPANPHFHFRYAFTSILGLSIATVCFGYFLYERMSSKKRQILVYALLAVVALNAGRVFFRNLDYKDDKAFYLSIVRDVPHSAIGLGGLADVLRKENQLAEALALYEKALMINPYIERNYNNYATILTSEGRIKDALRFLHKGLQMNPNYPTIHLNLARIYAFLEENEKAVQFYYSAIQVHPGLRVSYQELYQLLKKIDPKKAASFASQHADKL